MMMFALGDAAIQFALDCQGHVDRHRRHQLEQQASNRGIDIDRRHALAGGAACNSLIEANIAWPRMVAISDIHRAAASATHDAALRQSGPFAWRTECSWTAEALLIAPQPVLDLLEVSPGYIAGEVIGDHNGPRVRCQRAALDLPVRRSPAAPAAIDIGARVSRVGQHVADPAAGVAAPDDRSC